MAHLVLADDSTTIQKVVESSFVGEDIAIHSFGDGALALDYLRAHPTTDVLLVDLSLHDIDGYELCQEVKNNPATAHIPVVLLVGALDSFDAEWARHCGYHSHLTKPFETSHLVSLVKKMLAKPSHSAPSRLLKGQSEPPGEGFLFPIPIETGNEESVFSLTTSQCRPSCGLLKRHLAPLKPALPVLSGPGPKAPFAEPRVSLNAEELDRIVGKVLERFPDELRRLVPEIVQDVLERL